MAGDDRGPANHCFSEDNDPITRFICQHASCQSIDISPWGIPHSACTTRWKEVSIRQTPKVITLSSAILPTGHDEPYFRYD